MIANRTRLTVMCAGLLGALSGTAAAQTPLFGGRTPAPAPLSTRPTVPPPAGTTSVLPLIPPRSDTVQTAGAASPLFPTDTVATDVLAAPYGGVPGGAPMLPGIVPGAVYSPWCGPNAAGTVVGGNGVVTYEGYLRTGPSFDIGGGELSAVLRHGWMTAGGGRTLFFNSTNDAAWVLDLGVSFTRNLGRGLDRTTLVEARELRGGGAEFDPNDPNPNQVAVQPPAGLNIPLGIRAIRRTSLNFGIGRDWWLYGTGHVSETPGFGNWRTGFDIGGRWGTSSIDFEPLDEPGGVRHRQAVYHGVYVGSTLNWERQFGAVILQAGIRAEWGYDWLNLIPPQSSDLQNFNALMVFGLRY